MNSKFMKLIPFLCLGVVIYLGFRNIFTFNQLSLGDAPYFYQKGMNELVNEAYLWTERGVNFGGINLSLWLYPLMFLFGILGTFLKFGNEIVIRILFYLPSIFLTVSGSWLFAKYLKLSNVNSFFCSLIYTLNTYFLLLIDGGQLGISLAYGIFPFALITLLELTEKFNHKNFFTATIINTFLIIADPRVAIICFLTAFLIKPGKNLIRLIPLIVVLIGLSSYWLIPAIKVQNFNQTNLGPNLNFISLSNSLFLFQPHWPGNIFGKAGSPIFYFAIIPFLISLGLFFKTDRKILWLTFIFLIFAFLSKGGNEPFGSYYSLVLKHIPLGQAFRDPSKFFMPLTLLAGLLIGNSVSKIASLFNSFKVKVIFEFMVFLTLVLILYPALIGKFNFNLSGKIPSQDYYKLYSALSNNNLFFRTAWLPERSSYGFATEENPGLDGKGLVNLRPLASLTAGEDVFNFFNNKDYVKWLKLFGIKYLILTEDPRNPYPSDKEIERKKMLTDMLGNDKNLDNISPGLSFNTFQINDNFPRAFYTNKLYGVIGPDNFLDPQKPSVFLEDGKFNPADIIGVSPSTFELVLNGKNQTDLSLSYLQKYLVSPLQETM
ncbi:hypothetical protein HY045_02580, partial [Candidatus Woesebacteria bacterium]|nr:hypothetical protein [Candidatus Woesebacteria bacterium]